MYSVYPSYKVLVTYFGCTEKQRYNFVEFSPTSKIPRFLLPYLRQPLWKGLRVEKFMKNCVLWEGPEAGAKEEREKSSHRGGGSGRDNVWSTDHSPHFQSPILPGWMKQRKSGTKLSTGRSEEEDVLSFGFFSLSYSDVIGNKFIFPMSSLFYLWQ